MDEHQGRPCVLRRHPPAGQVQVCVPWRDHKLLELQSYIGRAAGHGAALYMNGLTGNCNHSNVATGRQQQGDDSPDQFVHSVIQRL